MVRSSSSSIGEVSANGSFAQNGGSTNGGRLHNLKFVIDARLYAWYNDFLKIVVGSSDLVKTFIKKQYPMKDFFKRAKSFLYKLIFHLSP